ncbi:hypothetical protein BGZ83_005911 [Gryganskiella cystojenkinii]|nr:hypothetical protein BGZ83_005911 [Gryganskiella cystojenkinii]
MVNCDHSSSRFAPVCCVHNGEGRPLLGYHNPQRQGNAIPEQQQLPAYNEHEYRLNMTDEKNGGQQPSSNGYLPMYSASTPETSHPCGKKCQKEFRIKGSFCKKLFWLLAFFWVYAHYIQPRYFSSSLNNTVESDINKDIILDSDMHRDQCKDHAVDWEGPSSFTTSAKNFKLRTGKGNVYSWVKIVKGPVSEPTLRLNGKVTPANEDAIKKQDHYEVVVQGVHLEITESKDEFDALIWFEDRWVNDDDSGDHDHRYKACAIFNLEIVLPEDFTEYGSITVDGGIIFIESFEDISDVSFELFKVKSAVGHFIANGLILADQFRGLVEVGKIKIEGVQPGKILRGPLDVEARVTTGNLVLNAYTTLVKDSSASYEHKIEATASTGSITLDVQPAKHDDAADNESIVDLSIKAITSTGSIVQSIGLANKEQVLNLRSKSSTGSVKAKVSDHFLGHFVVQTQLGSARVYENRDGSASEIVYEKQTAHIQEGEKRLKRDQDESSHGSIDLRSSLGSAALSFV